MKKHLFCILLSVAVVALTVQSVRLQTRLDHVLIFPAHLEGPAVVVEKTNPLFGQLAQRYASIGSGDLQQLIVYRNAALGIFEHNLAVLPLPGTKFTPEKL